MTNATQRLFFVVDSVVEGLLNRRQFFSLAEIRHDSFDCEDVVAAKQAVVSHLEESGVVSARWCPPPHDLTIRQFLQHTNTWTCASFIDHAERTLNKSRPS